MSLPLSTRRFIMAFFFSVFALIAPLLILYASGYRYDFKRHLLQRTGTLFLETEKVYDASIYINSVLYKSVLHKKIFIYTLLPGTYRIRVEKPGYHPWTREISIASSLTTFEKDIALFPDTMPTRIDSGVIDAAAPSPKNKLIAYITPRADGVSVRVFDSNQPLIPARELGRVSAAGEVLWSPNESYIGVRAGDRMTVLSVREPYEQFMLPLKGYGACVWDAADDGRIYCIRKNTVEAVPIRGGTAVPIVTRGDDRVHDSLFASGRSVYFAGDVAQETTVFEYSSLLNSVSAVATTPLFEEASIALVTGRIVVLQSKGPRGEIRLINIAGAPLLTPVPRAPYVDTPGSKISWDDGRSVGMVIDGGELAAISADQWQRTFLSRFGSEIVSAFFVQTGNYIAVSLPTGVFIHELGASSLGSPLRLLDGAVIRSAVSDANRETLYLTGTVAGHEGLFFLPLK